MKICWMPGILSPELGREITGRRIFSLGELFPLFFFFWGGGIGGPTPTPVVARFLIQWGLQWGAGEQGSEAIQLSQANDLILCLQFSYL